MPGVEENRAPNNSRSLAPAHNSENIQHLSYTETYATCLTLNSRAFPRATDLRFASGDRPKELITPRRFQFHRDFWALRDLSFDIRPGETFCIVGENGSGQEHILQMVAGILPPTSGTVSVLGRVAALLELGSGFNPEFSGRDNVYLNGSILGLSTRQIDQKFKAIEDFAEIGDFIHQPVKTYSSGMVVRLAFAVAINVDPEILLVDEALAVGDIYFRQRCMRKGSMNFARVGVTILFVSHSTGDVKAIADRVMWLEHGHMRDIGDPEMVISKYLAAMVEKDSTYLTLKQPSEKPARPAVQAPEIADCIPNVDHRYGDGRAEVLGIAVLDPYGKPVHVLEPLSRAVVRISVRAKEEISMPIVGFHDAQSSRNGLLGYEYDVRRLRARRHVARRHLYGRLPSGAAGALSPILLVLSCHRRRNPARL